MLRNTPITSTIFLKPKISMVPIPLLPLLHTPLMKSPKPRSPKPLWVKHKHTTSFQDWPCNLRKFYEVQGTWGDGKWSCLFLNSLWQVREGGFLYPRLCNPSDLLLWAEGSLHVSPMGAESSQPVNRPVSLSTNSHSESPPDSLQTHSLVKRTVQSQLTGFAWTIIFKTMDGTRGYWGKTCHLVNEALS